MVYIERSAHLCNEFSLVYMKIRAFCNTQHDAFSNFYPFALTTDSASLDLDQDVIVTKLGKRHCDNAILLWLGVSTCTCQYPLKPSPSPPEPLTRHKIVELKSKRGKLYLKAFISFGKLAMTPDIYFKRWDRDITKLLKQLWAKKLKPRESRKLFLL